MGHPVVVLLAVYVYARLPRQVLGDGRDLGMSGSGGMGHGGCFDLGMGIGMGR